MNLNSPCKRKVYFINKEFQGRIIFNSFVLLILGGLIFIGIFSFFSSNLISIVYDDYHLRLGTTPGILFKEILSTQWIFILLYGLLVCFITLRLTHRVAGAFYRLERSVDDMIQGKIFKKTILRKKDEGKNLALKIDTFNGSLSEDLTRVDDLCSEIKVSAEKLESEAGGQADKKTAGLVDKIKKNQEQIKSTIQKYAFKSDPS